MAKETKEIKIDRNSYVIADNLRHATTETKKHGKMGMLYKGDEIPDTITDEQILDLLSRKIVMLKEHYESELIAKEKEAKEKLDARVR